MPRPSKQNLSKLRHKGIIPGIIYGQSLKDPISIEVPLDTLQTIIKDTQTMIFHLQLEDTVYDCVLRDFQTDRLHTELLHVDFQFVKPEEVIKMKIPMIYEGIERLRSKKYVLEKAISKIPVIGPVNVLPEAFVVDTSNFKHGTKIFARDLIIPDSLELLLHPETIIATIQ